jgi:hypothetical protein
VTRPLTAHTSVLSCSSGCEVTATSKGAWDVTTIGAERLETEVAVILGVDTHLDFHVVVAVDHLGREAWASRACQRPRRVTGGSSTGRRISAP